MPRNRDPEQLEARLLRQMLPLAGARVLEIGSGEGLLVRRYADAAGYVLGVETAAARLAAARETCPPARYPRLAFSQARAERLPLAQAAVDVAIFASSL